MILVSIWQYYDHNLRFNVEASAVTFVVGYMVGIRRHFKKLHQHLHDQDAKTKLLHKHIKEIHKKVHQ